MDNLNSEILLAFPTVVPPIWEQESIVAVVAEMSERVAKTRSNLEHQMVLSLEHRQALITAAVTGELDSSRASRHERQRAPV